VIERLIKRDQFGAISEVGEGADRWIRRDTAVAWFGLGPLARHAAGREARALERLAGLDGVPTLRSWNGRTLERGWLDGVCLRDAPAVPPDWFPAARRLLIAIHRRGVAHNDLAKEPNWLVRADGRPALLDFQLASVVANPRSRRLRLLAKQDLRHLLKHKRTFFPERLTPVERRVLAERSWLSRLWRATFKRVYRLVTRGVLGWEDNEGLGRQRDGSTREKAGS
jgi:RIO-like serine/threonine protein kinase